MANIRLLDYRVLAVLVGCVVCSACEKEKAIGAPHLAITDGRSWDASLGGVDSRLDLKLRAKHMQGVLKWIVDVTPKGVSPSHFDEIRKLLISSDAPSLANSYTPHLYVNSFAVKLIDRDGFEISSIPIRDSRDQPATILHDSTGSQAIEYSGSLSISAEEAEKITQVSAPYQFQEDLLKIISRTK